MLLVIDNYDSFTFNVVRYLCELGAQVEVRRNDEITLAEIEALQPDALVVSPGPCTPNEAGVSLAAIQHFAGKLPILGVCLGHQTIGQVFGARVVRAQQVMHGKTSEITHNEQGLFAGLPRYFHVARYHSLVLEAQSLPDCLRVEAWVEPAEGAVESEAGQTVGLQPEIMAVSHRELPIHGIQFHPEAVLSEQGHNLFNNFLTKYGLV